MSNSPNLIKFCKNFAQHCNILLQISWVLKIIFQSSEYLSVSLLSVLSFVVLLEGILIEVIFLGKLPRM